MRPPPSPTAVQPLLIAAVLLVGAPDLSCGGDGDTPDDGGPDASTDGDADTDTETETETGTTPFEVWVVGFDFQPVPDVEICWTADEPTTCVTTDADGAAEIEIPSGATDALSLYHEDYYPTLAWLTAGKQDSPFAVPILALDEIAELYAHTDDTIDPLKGSLLLIAIDSTWSLLSDVTFAVDPPSGHGPIYVGLWLVPNPDLEATSSMGMGYVANADAIPSEITAEAPSGTCSLALGHAATPAPIAVAADSLNALVFTCD
jgi:hypothetical protein